MDLMKGKFAVWLCCSVLCALLLGCQGGGYEEPEYTTMVTGKLTKGGQPLTVNTAEYGDYARIELSLISLDEPGKQYDTTVAEDGTFEVTAPEGESLAGKYRIAVRHYPEADEDALQGEFDQDTSPIEREISAGTELTIDLDNPEG
jgi:hypothetical protein